MKDYELCRQCASGQKNVVGKKCQACIDNNMYEDKDKSKEIITRKGGAYERNII